MKIIILIVFILSSLLATNNFKYTITPMLGYDVNHKKYVEIGDHEVFGLSVSSRLYDSHFNHLELNLLQSGKLNYVNSSANTTITQLFINGVKSYRKYNNVQLYALGGLGYEEISNGQFNNASNLFINYGARLAYTFANNLSLKLDARHQFKLDADSSLIYTIGVSIPLGEKDTPLIVNTPAELVIIFDFNDDSIKNFDISRFEEYVSYLNKIKTATIIIEGHTDSIRKPTYNLDLSQRRADSVKKQLLFMGIKASKIKTINYGETKPISGNDTEENRKKNRRAVIRIENKQ